MKFLTSDDPRVEVGHYTYGDPKFLMWSDRECIRIGKFCSIADDVTIFGGGEHRTDWVTTYPLRIIFGEKGAGSDGHPHTKGATTIGDDVWLGNGATILSGVTIGSGAVIGARSVITRDVPPYAIVAGNPGRVIRMRFSSEQIDNLLSMAWWDWPIEKIRAEIPVLCSADMGRMLHRSKNPTTK